VNDKYCEFCESDECHETPWWKLNTWPAKTRTRRVLRFLWCLAFDWTEPVGNLYREKAVWPIRFIGEQAQLLWFRAHNNRFYRWLDEEVS
jgi:hypothetical protein